MLVVAKKVASYSADPSQWRVFQIGGVVLLSARYKVLEQRLGHVSDH